MDKPKLDIWIRNHDQHFDPLVLACRNSFFNHYFTRIDFCQTQTWVMKIMVIDFAETNHITDKLPGGINLLIEKEDGGRAYKTAGEQLPAAIFINYRDKPSHGRQTAISIRERKKTEHIPIYFVDGNASDNEKVNHLGSCITNEELSKFLKREV